MSTTEVIKQTYRDVEIIYVERDDEWNFFQLVTVTSQADPGRYNSGIYFWISKQDGRKKERSKESQFDLYAATPENEQRIARWRELNAQIDTLSKEQQELQDSMTHVERPEAVESV